MYCQRGRGKGYLLSVEAFWENLCLDTYYLSVFINFKSPQIDSLSLVVQVVAKKFGLGARFKTCATFSTRENIIFAVLVNEMVAGRSGSPCFWSSTVASIWKICLFLLNFQLWVQQFECSSAGKWTHGTVGVEFNAKAAKNGSTGA